MIKMYNFCDGLKLVVSRKHMNYVLIVINGGFWSLTFPSSWGLVSNSCCWPNCTNKGVSCICIRAVWILALKIISCNRYTHQDLFMHTLFIISRKVSLHFYQVCMQDHRVEHLAILSARYYLSRWPKFEGTYTKIVDMQM